MLEVVSDSLASALLGAAWSCRMHAAAYSMGVRLVLMISRSEAQTQVGACRMGLAHACSCARHGLQLALMLPRSESQTQVRYDYSPSRLSREQEGGGLGLCGVENRWVYVEQGVGSVDPGTASGA